HGVDHLDLLVRGLALGAALLGHVRAHSAGARSFCSTTRSAVSTGCSSGVCTTRARRRAISRASQVSGGSSTRPPRWFTIRQRSLSPLVQLSLRRAISV